MAKYSASSYDDYFCLKPPLLLWIATLFLSRAISLPLAVGLGHFAGVSSDATNVLQRLINLETLLPSALATAVLFAMFRRSPNASAAVRWVWSHGRGLLAAAAATDLALSVFALLSNQASDGQPLSSVIVVTIDFYFLVYVLFARRVRDTFAAFPLLATTQ